MISPPLGSAIADNAGTSSTATDATSGAPAPVPNGVAENPGSSGGAVGSSSQIYNQILSPALLNLPFLDQVTKQAQVLTASIGGDAYGTLYAAKPSPKPFIIGFIPPDVPVNYLPVSQVKSALADVNKQSANSKGGPSGTSSNAQYAAPGQPGLQPRVWRTYSRDELARAVIASMTKLNGTPPTPAQAGLVLAQLAIESGDKGGYWNYNLGNFHAGGGTVPLDHIPKNDEDIPVPQPAPKGGSYYVSYDTDSKGKPYACYFQNYDSLQGATDRMVGQLYGNWPGTRGASDPATFNTGLLSKDRGGNAPGGSYYEANSDQYLSGLSSGFGQWTNIAAKAGGGAPTAPASQGGGGGVTQSANTSAVSPTTDGPPIGKIMDNGDVCGADGDVLQSTLGRNIQVDGQRLKLTNAYVASIIADINRIKATPPLLLLVNPQSFERSYERGVDNSIKGRQGHIVHVWLEKPASISCKGVTAGQYTIGSDGTGGLTSQNRVQSISYENLLSMVLMYKNNAVIYDGFSQASGSLGVPIIQMSLYIYYDNHLYIGTFDDFSVEDEADKPYQMTYSFKFNVRYDIEVDTLSVMDDQITQKFTVIPAVPPPASGGNIIPGVVP